MGGDTSNSAFQPSFEYEGTTGYVKGSDTSRAHAEFEKKRAGAIQERVMNLIMQSAAQGMTSREIEDMTGLLHQTVSSSIRNLELDGYEVVEGVTWRGRVVKLKEKRKGGHPYVARSVARILRESAVLPPNPRRVSYKKKYETLVTGLQGLLDEWEEERTFEVRFDLIARLISEEPPTEDQGLQPSPS
jgi:hypothetical protein|tara:strand:- start:1832 stop:2395 length:564 start_codon:yes stop_codon:yes gene_type:complete